MGGGEGAPGPPRSGGPAPARGRHPGEGRHPSPFRRVQLAVTPMVLVKMTRNNKKPISGEKNTSSHPGFT